MKNALKRLQGRLRHRWYLHQARTTIARCNRSVARRSRIGVPVPRPRPPAPYFAPGIIETPGRPARRFGIRSYLVTLAIAIGSAVVYLVRAGGAS